MAAITDLSDLVNLCTGGNNGTPETIFWFKAGRIAGSQISGVPNSTGRSWWRLDGAPSGGAIPTSGAIPDNTTTGGFKQTDPGGSREKWLLVFSGVVASGQGLFVLYDRLFHIGGLSGTSTSDQTVQGSPASPALTRNTGGVGNRIAVEIYSGVGTSATTITASYTNEAGTGSRTTVAANFGGSANANNPTRWIELPLQEGDTGVQSVQSVKLNATTGTVGDFGVTIFRPLAFISSSGNVRAAFRDFTIGLPNIPKIDTDACLAMYSVFANGAAFENGYGAIGMIEK